MGINTKGFIHSENAENFAWINIVRYIDNKYGITHLQPSDRDFMTISFTDGNDNRSLSIFSRYTSYIHEGYPEFTNTNKATILPDSGSYITLFDVNCWGNSDDIIKGIVKHFGGGYFIHNDCVSDWENI